MNNVKEMAQLVAKDIVKRFRHDLDYVPCGGDILAKVHGDKLDITFYPSHILIEYADSSRCVIENINSYNNYREITSDIIELIANQV